MHSITTAFLETYLAQQYASAVHGYPLVAQKEKEVVRWCYAGKLLFNLEEFKDGVLPAGGWLYESKPEAGKVDIAFLYGFDEGGRPCVSRILSPTGELLFTGFFSFTDTCVWYKEYSQSGELSNMSVLLLKDGRKLGYMQLMLSGRLAETKPVIIARAGELPQGDSVFYHLEQYEYADDRIVYSNCYTKLMDGQKMGAYKHIYSYNTAGELDEIRRVHANNSYELIYVATPASTTLQQIVEELALLMAESIIIAINNMQWKSPVAIIRLEYQARGQYIPIVSVLTAEEKSGIMAIPDVNFLEFFLTRGTSVPFVPEPAWEKLYAAFVTRAQQDDDWWPHVITLNEEVAQLLTNRQTDNSTLVDDAFFAVAVDWNTVENIGAFLDVLENCGMNGTIWQTFLLQDGLDVDDGDSTPL